MKEPSYKLTTQDFNPKQRSVNSLATREKHEFLVCFICRLLFALHTLAFILTLYCFAMVRTLGILDFIALHHFL